MSAALTSEEKARFQALLLQRRAELAASLHDGLNGSNEEPATRGGGDVHDWKDDAFQELLKNTHRTELAHLRSELAATLSALERIRDGSYGRCSDCGREIGRERLRVQPSAPRCMPCQQRAELGSARRPGDAGL